jgi:hypothetical protein
MKYCCERFEMHHQFPRTHGLNVRVVKYSEKDLLDKKNLYRFHITNGYGENQKNVPNLNIAFCPFCGTHLFKYYDNDDYVNEMPGYF